MKKNLFAVGAICVAIALTGCNKKLNQFAADYFTTTPNPLEVVGADKVPATVTGNIPEKFFVKNAEVTVTPVLVYGDKETTSSPIYLQGEKVNGNAQVINYKMGGTVTIPAMFTYTDEMLKSELYLNFDVKQGKKSYVLPRVKVADGIVATAAIANAGSVQPATAHDKFQRIINEKHSADIKFLINQTNIRAKQLESEELAALHGAISEAQEDDRLEVKGVSISSYASPEGGVELNTRIAEGREKNTQKYLNKQIKKNDYKEFGELTAEFTAQDWEGFQELVSKSEIQDKDLILSVLSMYKDPEVREREIRNMSAVFDQLAKEILPELRYSRLTASIDVIGRSDDEIKAAYKGNAKVLSVDELLYCATLTDNNDEKLAIYNTCCELYPNDFRGYNNLGMCQFIDKDYEAAEASFNQAAKLNPQSKEVVMNQGLAALYNKEYNKANEKLGNAAGIEELPDALGVLYIQTGDYNAAVKAFGNSKTNNAALAQILTKDYSAAKNTLAAVANPDATTYYLMAVVGARTNNQEMVYSNLRKVGNIDADMLAKAKKDLEFAKFNLSNL